MEYPEEEKGRCRSCGFVAKHQRKFMYRIPGRTYFLVEDDERFPGAGQGDVFTYMFDPDKGREGGTALTELVCFVRAADFALTKGVEEARAILNEDRKCLDWYPFRPGLDPYEHLEEQKMQDLERRREKVNLQLASLTEEIAKIAARQWWVSLLALIVGALVVLIAAWLFQGDTNVNVFLPTPAPSPIPVP